MSKNLSVIKIILAVIVGILSILRIILFEEIGEKMDTTFLSLVVLTVLILLIPWERVTSFKAAGIEISLKPQVQTALASIEQDQVENKQLQRLLAQLSPEIDKIKGSRVLWIDDNHHVIRNERRLIRSFGIEVVTANSSEDAETTLNKDNDFDMIISDVQREGESHTFNKGVPVHEGVNFIIKLRKQEEQDLIIKNLPVVYYAAYDWKRLVEFTSPVRETGLDIEICNSFERLLKTVIRGLSEVRANPTRVPVIKKATSLR